MDCTIYYTIDFQIDINVAYDMDSDMDVDREFNIDLLKRFPGNIDINMRNMCINMRKSNEYDKY